MTANFIANENVDHFVAMLQDPRLEPETQKTLQKLRLPDATLIDLTTQQQRLVARHNLV